MILRLEDLNGNKMDRQQWFQMMAETRLAFPKETDNLQRAKAVLTEQLEQRSMFLNILKCAVFAASRVMKYEDTDKYNIRITESGTVLLSPALFKNKNATRSQTWIHARNVIVRAIAKQRVYADFATVSVIEVPDHDDNP